MLFWFFLCQTAVKSKCFIKEYPMSSSSFVSDNLKTVFSACDIRFICMTLFSHNHTMYLYLQKTLTSAPKISLFPLLWLSTHLASHDLPWIQSLQSNLASETILSDGVITSQRPWELRSIFKSRNKRREFFRGYLWHKYSNWWRKRLWYWLTIGQCEMFSPLLRWWQLLVLFFYLLVSIFSQEVFLLALN